MAASPPPAAYTTSQPPVARNTRGRLAAQTIATPTYGAGGRFSVEAATRIAAPPDVAFAALLEHAAWPAWNRFVPRVTMLSAPPPRAAAAAAAAPPSGSALEAAVAQDDGARYIKMGARMVFEVHMSPGQITNNEMVVTALEPFSTSSSSSSAADAAAAVTPPRHGWRVAWKAASPPALLLRSERVQELVDDGAGGTEYTCWETMYGPMAPLVRWMHGANLERGFEAWGQDLKARAEAVAGGGGDGGAAAS